MLFKSFIDAKERPVLHAVSFKQGWLGAALGMLLAAGPAHAQSGNALNFDGVDDYVTLPVSLTSGVTNFTFEAWLKYQDNGSWTRVMDFGTGTTVYLFLTPSNSVNRAPRFAITTGGPAAEQVISGTQVLSAGQHHLAVTLSQNGSVVTGTLYVDGDVAATNSNMTLTPASLGTLSQGYLGRSEFSQDPYLKGELDEVRFYSTALTQAQVQADMRSSNGTSAVPGSLLAYYDFNQGIANGNNPGVTTLTDRTSNGRNGTLSNFALNGTTSNWVGSTAPLPVTLVSFTAQRQDGAGLLAWTTASELHNAYYEVESSRDGRTFQALGRVAGHGTTAQAQTYQFTDAYLARYAAEVVYYRLRQVDADGTSTYSPVRTLAVPSSEAEALLAAFPTRLTGGQELRVQVRPPHAGAASLLVTDALGQVVLQRALELPAGPTAFALPQAAQWTPGLYLLRVQQGKWQQVSKVTQQ